MRSAQPFNCVSVEWFAEACCIRAEAVRRLIREGRIRTDSEVRRGWAAWIPRTELPPARDRAKLIRVVGFKENGALRRVDVRRAKAFFRQAGRARGLEFLEAWWAA